MWLIWFVLHAPSGISLFEKMMSRITLPFLLPGEKSSARPGQAWPGLGWAAALCRRARRRQLVGQGAGHAVLRQALLEPCRGGVVLHMGLLSYSPVAHSPEDPRQILRNGLVPAFTVWSEDLNILKPQNLVEQPCFERARP